MTHRPERLDQIGENACAECHAQEVRDWERSHHAHANRPINPALDRPAFTPPREVVEEYSAYRLTWEDGARETLNDRILRPASDPFQPTGGLVELSGSLGRPPAE